MLRDQGLSKKNMDSVFHALILCKIRYRVRCVHGVVTLLRLTRGKLMPSYAGCIVMDMWVQSIILMTWYVLLMLNCFLRCVKCIIALIIFSLKWKLPIIYCVRDYHYELPSWHYSLFRNSFSFAVFSNSSDYILVDNCCCLFVHFCMYVCYIQVAWKLRCRKAPLWTSDYTTLKNRNHSPM